MAEMMQVGDGVADLRQLVAAEVESGQRCDSEERLRERLNLVTCETEFRQVLEQADLVRNPLNVVEVEYELADGGIVQLQRVDGELQRVVDGRQEHFGRNVPEMLISAYDGLIGCQL